MSYEPTAGLDPRERVRIREKVDIIIFQKSIRFQRRKPIIRIL